jgi:hypothetical protein
VRAPQPAASRDVATGLFSMGWGWLDYWS